MSKRGREAEQLLLTKNKNIYDQKKREMIKSQKKKDSNKKDEKKKNDEKLKKVTDLIFQNLSPIANKGLKKKFEH